MRSATHGAVGGMIMLSSPNIIVGACGAFLSHFLIDYLEETTFKDYAFIDATLLGFFIIGAALGKVAFLGLLGWFFALLPDLIDKPRMWILGKDSWFSCHGGDGLIKIRGYRLGHKWKGNRKLYKFSLSQTLVIDSVLTLLFCLSALL